MSQGETAALGAPDDDLFENAPCGYVVTDGSGLIVAANAEFHRLVGHPAGTLTGRRTLGSLLPIGGRIFLETHLLPMLEHDGVVREIAIDLLRSDGERVPVLVNATTASDTSQGVGLRVVFLETRDRHRYERDLLQATRAAERARREATDLAQTLQQTLIPPAPPAIPHLSIAATYRPAGDGTVVGGDFYDVFQVGLPAWMVVLGDVSGKGVSAAAVTAFVRHSVRALAVEHPDPADLLHRLDRALHLDDTGHYCTLVVARLVWHDGRWSISLALAGHPPPLLRTPDGGTRELGRYGSPVGLVEHPIFHTVEHDLGDETITFYTDGVTEARNGRHLYGEDRLHALLTELPHEPSAITEGIAGAVLDYQEGTAVDDIAIVSFAATLSDPD
jgi:sigma-B regulation protein RsbU (phosphoserine phosphatase)